MSYVLNKDAKFKIGGRNIARLTEQEFLDLARKYCMNYQGSERDEDVTNEWTINPPSDQDVLNMLIFYAASSGSNEDGSTVGNDFKGLEFSNENTEPIEGVRMTKGGCPYVVGYSGGDWENPVCFIVFYDGKQIRAYLPKSGNTWRTYAEIEKKRDKSGNWKSKMVTKKIALGNDEDADTDYVKDNLKKTKQIPSGYTPGWDDVNEIEPDYDLCIAEFLARVGEN